MKNYVVVLLSLVLLGCGSDGENGNANRDFTAENEQEILDYIAQNNLDAQRTDSGLYYVIENPGTGATPTLQSQVTVAYRGYFTNGQVFDQSGSNGIQFPLNGVITGWQEGIPLFREGGNGILLIPSQLGYGNAGIGSIPGGAVLIFDITLIRVE